MIGLVHPKGRQSMGRTASPIAVVSPTIGLDDVLLLEAEQAKSILGKFCADNGFDSSVRRDAFKLFRRAAAQPNKPIKVPTSYSGTAHAQRVHDCMQLITDHPVTSGLAERAFDIAPGSHFEHSLREDRCQLTSICTNAQSLLV